MRSRSSGSRQTLFYLLINGWWRRPQLWLQQGRELSQRLSINGVGFRAFEQRFGKMMGLCRVHPASSIALSREVGGERKEVGSLWPRERRASALVGHPSSSDADGARKTRLKLFNGDSFTWLLLWGLPGNSGRCRRHSDADKELVHNIRGHAIHGLFLSEWFFFRYSVVPAGSDLCS